MESEEFPNPQKEEAEKSEHQKRFTSIDIKFKERKYAIPPLFRKVKWNSKDDDRTLLNDTIIEFYLCEYMFNAVYDDEARSRVYIFHTFFYTRLRVHFRHYFYAGAPRRSELGEQFHRLFQKLDPSAILKKELLVIPVHLEKPKHWFLVIVHNPSGAIRRHKFVSQEEKDFYKSQLLTTQISKFVEYEAGGECRIIILDSLCHSKKYCDVLNKSHSHAFDHIRLWLQMASAAAGEEYMSSRVRKSVCQELPKQTNSVDCGIYLLTFAEYFTWFNTDWMNLPTESLVFMKVDDDLQNVLDSDESRHRLDKLFQTLKAPVTEQQGILES